MVNGIFKNVLPMLVKCDVFRIASEHLEGIDVNGRIFLPYPPTLLIVSFTPLIIFN
jgi:hypothetical protein